MANKTRRNNFDSRNRLPQSVVESKMLACSSAVFTSLWIQEMYNESCIAYIKSMSHNVDDDDNDDDVMIESY